MSFTLNDLYAAVKKNYISYELELPSGAVLELRNPLRLGDDRKKFKQLHEQLTAEVDAPAVNDEQAEDESDEDFKSRLKREVADLEEFGDRLEAERIDVLAQMITLLAVDKDPARQALKIFGKDLAILMTLLQEYTEQTQVGEA